ncbi:MAG: DUF4872 domain-containing protein [Acidobacteria bacterium]|nr:DUF4872 domain-containing protein [Acidobacteriota bacterium]MBI3423781.1 DUF4872 domain-containing protein [Acidobacteriota bacterium]
MTAQKHLKQLIRARMQKTGERYATARRHLIGTIQTDNSDPSTRWHFPGNVPATTALRIMLAHHGVRAPHTGEPFTEAMLFGLAGGIGIGVFAFYYQREDHASFFLAGRHQWHDDAAYLAEALQRFGIKPVIQESGGAKAAEQQLRAALAHGPCIAWVDMAELPHRAMPSEFSGGGYHVIVVYRVNDEDGTALIGDLTDAPISIPLADLARSRARIKKQKQRLLSLDAKPAKPNLNLDSLVRVGLQRCHEVLQHPTLPGMKSNGKLEALRTWAQRLHGGKDKEAWGTIFKPGANLWRGLTWIYDCIENYGTGGGLCRPLFAEFLQEAASALGQPKFAALGEQYAALGRQWSELAEAALPDDVPLMRAAKELYIRRRELLHDGAPVADVRAVWQELGALAQQAGAQFPLTDTDCGALRAQLQTRVLALYEGEVAAQAALLTTLA